MMSRLPGALNGKLAPFMRSHLPFIGVRLARVDVEPTLARGRLGERAMRGRGSGCAKVRAKKPAGFSLIELMVTVAVLAVILAIASPSFIGIFNSNRLATHANQLVAGLQAAKSEAVRRNARITVCRSQDGASCAGADGPWANWLIVDANGAVLRAEASKAPVQLTASVNRFSFAPDGRARATDNSLLNATLVACIPTSQPAENRREINIRLGGAVAVESTNGAGVCPNAANP